MKKGRFIVFRKWFNDEHNNSYFAKIVSFTGTTKHFELSIYDPLQSKTILLETLSQNAFRLLTNSNLG